MRNYKNEGSTVVFAHNSDVNSGQAVLKFGKLVVANNSFKQDEEGVYVTSGVFELPAKSDEVFEVLEDLYWDNTNKLITKTATGNTKVGFAHIAKATGEELCEIKIIH